jgi:SAM-dependent methyltransferase
MEERARAEATVGGLCKILKRYGIWTGKVLDLCCGTGRMSTAFARKGFKAIGLDISPPYIEEARRRARRQHVESLVRFYIGDMRMMDKVVGLERPFDCVLSFRNSFGFWGDEVDEAIFTNARQLTKKGGVLVIGECDHLAQLMVSFDRTRVYESKSAVMFSEADMDYISGMFKAKFRYYRKKGDVLTYGDTFDYQARVYTVSELSSLLKRAGWKVARAYEDLQDLEPFTHRSAYKGTSSMNLIARAV